MELVSKPIKVSPPPYCADTKPPPQYFFPPDSERLLIQYNPSRAPIMEITQSFCNSKYTLPPLSQVIMVAKVYRVPQPDSSKLRMEQGSFTSWKILSSQLWCSFKVPGRLYIGLMSKGSTRHLGRCEMMANNSPELRPVSKSAEKTPKHFP